MTVNQTSLNYTHRDLLTLDDDLADYIKEYIPRITDTSKVNSGRLFLTAVGALIDNLNYSVDQIHLETLLDKCRQKNNALAYAYSLGYKPYAVSASSVDLTYTMITGVAPPGGQAIPIYTRSQTGSSPILETITVAAATIPAGESSISGVEAVQGVLTTGEVLTAAATGLPLQIYKLSNAKTPHEFIEVLVNGVTWSLVDDFADSEYNDRHFVLIFDEDDYTYVCFGDGEHGEAPSFGAAITTNYITTTTLNIAAAQISKVVGVLASVISVTNPIGSSGGGGSETIDSIKLNAPAYHRTSKRIVNKADAVTHAKRVSGVYNAFAVASGGARIDVYVFPVGGGIASSYLVAQVQAYLDSLKMEGMIIYVHYLYNASIFIEVNVITKDRKTVKSTVKSKVKKAITDQLYYTNLKPGRGFALSDTNGFLEEIDDKQLVDYCDFVVHSRIPRIEQSNVSAPTIVGRVEIGETCGYDTWVISAISATQFTVSKSGVVQSVYGTVATAYTSDNNEVSFTLGVSGDVLTVGDTWIFKTSKYKDNMYLDSKEMPVLELDSDLTINVFFPDEYDITTQALL